MRILILLLLYCSLSFSQKHEGEYVVTHANDTIYGKIRVNLNYPSFSKYRFKIKPKDGKVFTIKPDKIKSFYVNHGAYVDSFYVSFYESMFFQKIIEGRINLYRIIETNLYYLSKDYSSLEYIRLGIMKRKKAHKDVRRFIEDNPKIVGKFDKQKGNLDNVINIIKEYNRYYEILWGRVNYEVPRSAK